MRTMRIALACLLAALASACAQKDDSPEAVAHRFYDFYIAQQMNNGLPTIEQCRQMAPLLSRAMQDAIGTARREQDKFTIEHPGEKPPFVDGDLFTSLFEGATSYQIGKVDTDNSHADVLVVLKYDDPKGDNVEWTDRLVLVQENGHWVVEDVEYGGNWDFANHGSLRASLLSDDADTAANKS